MGMLLRRHYATADPVEPVEQTEAVSVEEMPKVEFEQAAVTEVVKEPKAKTVRHMTTTRKTGKNIKRK